MYPSGWGVLYYNVQSSKWRICNGSGVCKDVGSGSGGSSVWGGITGSISSQIDLRDSLANKRALKSTLRTFTSDHTGEIADAWKNVFMNSASAINYTVPPNSSVAYPLYTEIWITQTGAGLLTIVQGSGVTVTASSGTLDSPGQNAMMRLYKTGTNTWLLSNGTAILPIDLTTDVTDILPGANGGTGVNNTGKTITVSGAVSIGSSTHTVTLSTSGNTSITIPTSGTVATQAGTETFTNKTINGGSNTITNIPFSTGISGLGTGVATAAAININALGGLATNPMTTSGDVIYGGASGVPTRLATGTGYLKGGSTPTWSTINLASDVGTSRLPFANLTQGSARSVIGVPGNSTSDAQSIQSSAAGQMLSSTGTSIQWSEVTFWTAFKTTTTSSAVTGTTSETIVFSQLVTGGTFDIDDVLTWTVGINKTGNNATMTVRIYVNDTNDLTTPQLWGTFPIASNGIYTLMTREIAFKGSVSSQKVANETTSVLNDYSSGFNTTPLTSSVNFANDQYFIVTCQPNSSSDTFSLDRTRVVVSD
jgi:hypothetical protein